MRVPPKYQTIFLSCCVLSLSYACNENGAGKSPLQTSASENHDIQFAADSLPKTDRGREIFQARCNTCHGISGNSEYQGNSLYTKAANLQLSKLDSISVANAIKNGREGMPSFGGTIPDSDMAQLVTYVKSLRKS